MSHYQVVYQVIEALLVICLIYLVQGSQLSFPKDLAGISLFFVTQTADFFISYIKNLKSILMFMLK